ncbi:MAG TPA: IS21 family transposase [Trebonia sp.]|nr:IS21 family transposase [Trebonia sp.]
MLTVEDWAEIRRLHRAEKMPVKAIVRALGISRNTVRAALASDGPPKYERKPAGSAVDMFEPRIRELLQAYPTMPATVIAERVGWDRGITVLKERVRELRPAYLPPDPASRTAYEPGELAQCDFWFPPVSVPAGPGQERRPAQLPVLTMVSAYSRWLSAVLVPSRHAADLFAGWWQLINGLGGVPRALVWDGEGAIGRWRAGKPELTEQCQAFRGTLGTRVVVCKPADPESKGLVERANGYLETSFLPGREFASPEDFNAQLTEWTALVNTRTRRALGCAPAERIAADRAAMLTLPPVAPETGWRLAVRLPRDHYVRLDSNDYSVHPAAIGRRVEVVAGLDRVRAWCGGQLAADHERSWARHQVVTDPEHKAAAVAMRRQRVGVLRPAAPEPEVEQRSLSVYDALTAGDGEGAA